MATLSAEQLAWAKGVGLTVERAEFLADCPGNTVLKGSQGGYERGIITENKYLMKSGTIYYFRVHATPTRKAHIIPLGRDLTEARRQRDVIAVGYGGVLPTPAVV